MSLSCNQIPYPIFDCFAWLSEYFGSRNDAHTWRHLNIKFTMKKIGISGTGIVDMILLVVTITETR